MDYPGASPAPDSMPPGKGPAAPQSTSEAPVKEITLCVYADGSYGVKDGGNEQKAKDLNQAMSLIQSAAGGGDQDQDEMAGMKEGFDNSPAGGAMGTMA